MALHRTYGPADEADAPIGDAGFVGVDARSAPEKIAAGSAAEAVNKRFARGCAETRAGWVTPCWAGVPVLNFDGNHDGREEGVSFPVDFVPGGFGETFGDAVFSDPDGNESRLVAVRAGTWCCAQYSLPTLIRLPGNAAIEGPVRMVQCFDRMLMFRGEDLTPLEWNPTLEFTDGYQTWSEIADPTPSGGFTERIPNAADAICFANRVWVVTGRDQVAVSDLLDYTVYDPDLALLRINAGTDDAIVRLFPAAAEQLVVFKRRSVYALSGVWGENLSASLQLDVGSVTRGLVGRDAVCQVGSKIVWVGDRAIWTASLNTANKFVFDEKPLSHDIEGIMARVHWRYGATIQCLAHDDRLYVAVPLDQAQEPNAVLVYNVASNVWEGYWTAPYLAVRSLSLVTEDEAKRIAVLNGTGKTFGRHWLEEVTDADLQAQAFAALPRSVVGAADGALFLFGEGKTDFVHGYTCWIADELLTRGYALAPQQAQRDVRLSLDHETWDPSFRVWIRRGASGSEKPVAQRRRGFDRTYSQSDVRPFDADWPDTSRSWDVFNQHLPAIGVNEWGWFYGKDRPAAEVQAAFGDGTPWWHVVQAGDFWWQWFESYTAAGAYDETWIPDPDNVARAPELAMVRVGFGIYDDWWPFGYHYDDLLGPKVWTLRIWERARPENYAERTLEEAETALAVHDYGTWITLDLPLPMARYPTRASGICWSVAAEDQVLGPWPSALLIASWAAGLETYVHTRTQKVFQRPLVRWASGSAPAAIEGAGHDDYAWALGAGIGSGLTFGKTQRQNENWRVEMRGDLFQVRLRNTRGYSALHGVRLDTQTGRRAPGTRMA